MQDNDDGAAYAAGQGGINPGVLGVRGDIRIGAKVLAFAGRSKINQAFALRNLAPDIVLEAIDADVIKTYVELGLGVGIMADIAFNPERDKHLRGAEHITARFRPAEPDEERSRPPPRV